MTLLKNFGIVLFVLGVIGLVLPVLGLPAVWLIQAGILLVVVVLVVQWLMGRTPPA